MKYLFSALLFLLFIVTPVQALADVITGVQLPQAQTIDRLIPSQYSFQWVKFQYSLGSSQPLESWVNYAKQSSSGGGKTYQVLISVAKNTAGIQTLQNPDYPPLPDDQEYTHQYCPWDNELEQFPRTRMIDCLDSKGQPSTCPDPYTVKATPKTDNGYTKFRDAMQALAPRLANVAAVEVWNEPNLEDEWTKQNLGPVSPENYVNFLNCGIKGLRKGGYTGIIVSAGLAPNAYATATGQTNMNDIDFFNRFVSAGGLNNIDAIGWHSNITSDIAPDNSNDNGFQRVKHALGKGKPVWLTEFGWDRSTFSKKDDYEKRQIQAQYITQAYEVAGKLGGIAAMFVWNFGFTKDAPGQSAFFPWDIEGTVPKGLLCQPNPQRTTRPEKGNTSYVHDESIAKNQIAASVAGIALLPRIITDETNQKVKNATGTDVQVTKSFLSELLNFLKNFLCSALGKISGLGGYCIPNLSVGIAESGTNPPGKNTQQFALQSNSLSKTAIPQGMNLIPEDKDCNLGQIEEDGTDIGNQKLNELSETMGTTTGFYGNGMPDFKTLTPNEWEASIQDQMQKDNLNIGNKLFRDKRPTDMYLRKQVFCKGNYPNDICPFEPTPTPK